jgi:ABC-type multidrug transport system ATPase subunit
MTASDLVIETHGLTKRCGDRVAVDDLTLRVSRGEVYGFLGQPSFPPTSSTPTWSCW